MNSELKNVNDTEGREFLRVSFGIFFFWKGKKKKEKNNNNNNHFERKR